MHMTCDACNSMLIHKLCNHKIVNTFPSTKSNVQIQIYLDKVDTFKICYQIVILFLCSVIDELLAEVATILLKVNWRQAGVISNL